MGGKKRQTDRQKEREKGGNPVDLEDFRGDFGKRADKKESGGNGVIALADDMM